jgi:sensor domain CHASE-containing protein
MRSLLFYLGGLLLALIAVNVLIVRTIRAEKRREAEERRLKSQR